MAESTLLASGHAPEALYENFQDFVARHQAMTTGYNTDYVSPYLLVRLARGNLEQARRVFDWAVKRVCVDMLASKQFPQLAEGISPQGLKWAEQAERVFGRDPLRSISLVEGVFVLERLAVWAEINFKNELRGHGYSSLTEFRKRPESGDNQETAAKTDWLDLIYQTARARAIDETVRYVKRRSVAIGICMTAMAGGFSATDQEIDEAMHRDFPTHQSLAKRQTLLLGCGRLTSATRIVAWVLGPHNAEIAF